METITNHEDPTNGEIKSSISSKIAPICIGDKPSFKSTPIPGSIKVFPSQTVRNCCYHSVNKAINWSLQSLIMNMT